VISYDTIQSVGRPGVLDW